MVEVKKVIKIAIDSHNSAKDAYANVHNSDFGLACVRTGFLASIAESLIAIAMMMCAEGQDEEPKEPGV